MNEESENIRLLPPPVFIKCSYEKYRSFHCNSCGLGFKEVNDLRNHLLTTSLEKAICPICSHVFSTVKGMKQHYGKLHSSHRPSRCAACRKRFRNKYALKFHVKQVHEQSTREQCPNCLRFMYNQYSLNRHLKKCREISDHVSE